MFASRWQSSTGGCGDNGGAECNDRIPPKPNVKMTMGTNLPAESIQTEE